MPANIPTSSSASLWVRLPYEVHLNIFNLVFNDPFSWFETIEVEKHASKISYRWAQKRSEQEYGGILSCFDSIKIGPWPTAATAEVLYRSGFIFGVDVELLPGFLTLCPLSHAVQPGRYIQQLKVYMDEDPNFVGDGKDAQQLRKADWVDIESEPEHQIATDSNNRTQLMRQCWKCVLNVPNLYRLEVMMTACQGRASQREIFPWEFRDILPMYYSVMKKGVCTFVYLCPGATCEEDEDEDDNRLPEDQLDLDWSLQSYRRNAPDTQDQSRANLIAARNAELDFPPADDRLVRSYDAILELIERLEGDPDYEIRDGDLRRKRLPASDTTAH